MFVATAKPRRQEQKKCSRLWRRVVHLSNCASRRVSKVALAVASRQLLKKTDILLRIHPTLVRSCTQYNTPAQIHRKSIWRAVFRSCVRFFLPSVAWLYKVAPTVTAVAAISNLLPNSWFLSGYIMLVNIEAWRFCGRQTTKKGQRHHINFIINLGWLIFAGRCKAEQKRSRNSEGDSISFATWLPLSIVARSSSWIDFIRTHNNRGYNSGLLQSQWS